MESDYQIHFARTSSSSPLFLDILDLKLLREQLVETIQIQLQKELSKVSLMLVPQVLSKILPLKTQRLMSMCLRVEASMIPRLMNMMVLYATK